MVFFNIYLWELQVDSKIRCVVSLDVRESTWPLWYEWVLLVLSPVLCSVK
jgi:hypothetical protein